MTLIDCPECDKCVSDFATACPSCGFPVAEGIRQAVAELTDGERAMSVRQQQAVTKLKVWGERYKSGDDLTSRDDTFLDRHWKPIVLFFVTVILVIQLTWVLSLFN